MKIRNAGLSLIGIMAIVCAAGCGGQTSNANANAAAETAAETAASEESITDTQETADSEPLFDDEASKLALDTTIEETVLFDDGTVSVKATELTFRNNTPELTLEIANNSDKKLKFLAGTLGYSLNSVNGIMVHTGYLNEEVGAGKTATEKVSFDADELMICGISEISEIKMAIEIEDEDNQDYARTGPISIPTSAYDKWDKNVNTYQKALHSGVYEGAYDIDLIWEKEETFFEAENVSIVSAALVKNSYDETSLLLELENRSDKIIDVSFSDIEINGLVFHDGSWTGDMMDQHTRCIESININDVASYGGGSLEAMGISDITSAGFSIELEDENYNTLKTEDVKIVISGDGKPQEYTGEEVYNDHGIKVLKREIDDSDSTYYNAVYLVSNDSDAQISVGLDYDSLSVNDKMTDFINYSLSLKPGKTGALNIKISKDDAGINGITALSDIKNMEFVLQIKDADSYTDIDTPTVKVTY